jgi:hypothetical protein
LELARPIDKAESNASKSSGWIAKPKAYPASVLHQLYVIALPAAYGGGETRAKSANQ